MKGHRFVKTFEEGPDFDSALAKAVQIVEEEGIKAPTILIEPRWIYPEDDSDVVEGFKIVFDIEVSTNFNRKTGEEIMDPKAYMEDS